MAGKGAKATSAKAAEKEKGKKAPASRSSRAGPQVSSTPVLFASYVGYRFGLDAVLMCILVFLKSTLDSFDDVG
jgi:hypothetical protein